MAAKQQQGSKVGRGTRWTEDQVKLLLDSVRSAPTAKEAFEKVAKELGKNTGTVQQKYYSVVRASGEGTSRARRGSGARGRAGGASQASGGSRGSGARTSAVPSSDDLRQMQVDDLIGLARNVKEEVDRRRRELDEATKLFG